MKPAERERFHNLLLMAKESPFEGERSNALEAADLARSVVSLQDAPRLFGGPGRFADERCLGTLIASTSDTKLLLLFMQQIAFSELLLELLLIKRAMSN